MPKEIQNLLILTYADQTNRSFRHVRNGGSYSPTLEDLPNELELCQETLPDLKDWNDAVTRVAEVLGHAVSKLLNASNLAMLGTKAQESITEFKADCDALPDQLQLVLSKVGVAEAEYETCDRVRTAKAVKAFLQVCEGRQPTSLVGAIIKAKIETNSTAMGKSLKSAKSMLGCLRSTRWDLFSAVTQLTDHRKASADLLIQDVCKWLKTDEHALVGGLAAKLSAAEGEAIKLLTPPKPVVDPPVVVPPPVLPPIDLPKPKPGWKQFGTGSKARLSHDESVSEAKRLLETLEQNSKLRLTVQWTLEEESP